MLKSDAPKERLSDYGAMNTPPAGKKHRLSRFMGPKEVPGPVVPGSTAQPDSTYGSSETNPGNIVQVENDGTIPNTRKEQNLALDKGTGEVFDEDTGDVVTVVTTTTTTTTTTTHRGNQQHRDVKKDVQTTSTQHPHGAPMTGTYNDPAADLQYTAQPSRDSAYSSGLAPDIPARSARRSGEYDVSPNFSGEVPTSSSSRPNFSYPSRNPPAGTTPVTNATAPTLTHQDTSSSRRSGRFADLKAAAIGLHGVGETLRGTLNSEIDARYRSKNPEKAAAIDAKNAAVLERGRNEMSGIPVHNRNTVHSQNSMLGQNTVHSSNSVLGQNTGHGSNSIIGQTPVHDHNIFNDRNAVHSSNSVLGQNTSHGSNSVLGQNTGYGSSSVLGSNTPHGLNTAHDHTTYDDRNPISPITDHDASYTHHNLGESSIGRTGTFSNDHNSTLHGSAAQGNHSTVSGLPLAGERQTEPSPLHNPAHSINDSSVSNLTSASGDVPYHPPRGTAVRFDSATAPETITGNVEKVPTLPSQQRTNTNTGPSTTTDEHSTTDGGVKKQGTLSKLFKRKPVGGEQSTTEAERKRFY